MKKIPADSTTTYTKNYNGPRSKLMDEISYALNEHTDPWEYEGWATLELYLARACVSVEKRRKRNEGNDRPKLA